MGNSIYAFISCAIVIAYMGKRALCVSMYVGSDQTLVSERCDGCQSNAR